MSETVLLAEPVIQKIRSSYPVRFALVLKFDGCIVAVMTNSGQLAHKLSVYFRSFVTEAGGTDILITVHQAPSPDFDLLFSAKMPDPGKKDIKEEYVDVGEERIVRKRRTGMVLIFGEGENLAIGPCEENDNQVINFINNRYIEWKLKQGGLLGHAAAVSAQGVGIALAGFSGMGKSTLALRLLGKGLDFVSNDRLVIQKKGDAITMFGVAKHPRINPGTIMNNPHIWGLLSEKEKDFYGSLPPEDLWELEHKYDLSVEKYYGKHRFRLRAEMKGLVILNWKKCSDPCICRIVDISRRTDLLGAFMKATGLFFMPDDGKATEAGPEAYLDLLGDCRVLEITGGIDFEAAAEHCITFMRS